MCYLYLKLRVFLERKVKPKSVLKRVVSFIYNIDIVLMNGNFIKWRIISLSNTTLSALPNLCEIIKTSYNLERKE